MADRTRTFSLAIVLLAVCASVSGSPAQWARQPGEVVRDHFGPRGGFCRGACGMGCPTGSCEVTVGYECAAPEAPDRLRRVRSFVCGTHQGCRDHDDCLDRCRQRQEQGLDCDAQCHQEAVDAYGFENAMSWGTGNGPFDDQRITFEYTREAPDEPEPLFRCPAGSSLSCRAGPAASRCVTGAGVEITPVFDAYADTGGMRISDFRSGRVCRDNGQASGVCEQTTEIAVTGDRAWYGFEFDYANADPSAPLMCSSRGAEDDFMGRAMKSVITLIPTNDSSDLGQVLGRIQSEIERGASLTDILSGISVRPAGTPAPPPAPVASEPGVPTSVPIPAASGHLVVPMFELASASPPGSTMLREVRCTHNGTPVLEATFQFRF